MNISFIGAGNVARALGALFQRAGHNVLFGSRDRSPGEAGRVVSVAEAAAASELIVITVPFVATREVLPPLQAALAGKIVVDATNPVHGDWSPMLLGEQNSAGEEVAKLLPKSRVVKAFNTIFADVMRPERLVRGGQRITCFVASNDTEAAQAVAKLAQDAGLAPRAVGPLKMARHLEAMAHLNIQIAVGMQGGTDAAFVYH